MIDRNGSPSHGYRAIHIVVRDFGPPYEIQVRTELQNRWAQLSERLNDIFPGIKYGAGPPDVQRALSDLSDRTDSTEREFVHVMDSFETRDDTDHRFAWRQENRLEEEINELKRRYSEFKRRYGV